MGNSCNRKLIHGALKEPKKNRRVITQLTWPRLLLGKIKEKTSKNKREKVLVECLFHKCRKSS